MVVIVASLFLPFTPQFEIKSSAEGANDLLESELVKDTSVTNTIPFSGSSVGNVSAAVPPNKTVSFESVTSGVDGNDSDHLKDNLATTSFYEAGLTPTDVEKGSGVFDPHLASDEHKQLSTEGQFKSQSILNPVDLLNEKIQSGDLSNLKQQENDNDGRKIAENAILLNVDDDHLMQKSSSDSKEESEAFMNSLTANASTYNINNANPVIPKSIDSVASQVNVMNASQRRSGAQGVSSVPLQHQLGSGNAFSNLLNNNMGSSANIDSDYNSLASSLNSSATNLNRMLSGNQDLQEPQPRQHTPLISRAHLDGAGTHQQTSSLLKQVSHALVSHQQGKSLGTIITPKSRDLPSVDKNIESTRDLKAGLSSTTSMKRIHRKSSGASPQPGMDKLTKSNSQSFSTRPILEIDDLLDSSNLIQTTSDSIYNRQTGADGTFSDDGVASNYDIERNQRIREFKNNEIPKFGGYSNAEFIKLNILGGQQNIFSKADWSIVSSQKCNTGLKNAINTAIFEKTFNQPVVFYGTLGLPTDVLPEDVLKNVTDKMRNEYNCESVISDDITFKGAYKNFCKEILWPTFHYQIPDNPKSKAFELHSWNHYQLLNQKFADKIVETYNEGDTVWVNDYHLLLVPGMVRDKLPDAKIGFSLHISFPSSEVFRCFAQRDFILKGLLGANSLGFQTEEYARHFALTCNRLMQTDGDVEEGIKFNGRTIQICCVPIGVDAFELEKKLRNSEDFDIFKNIIKDRWALGENKKLIVSKDQFDALRGLKTKLLAYEKFLRENPSYISRVCFVQVVTGSTKKDKYLEKEVVSLVDRINNLSADITMHQNIILLTQELNEIQYFALLSEADIFWVNSMREGMNLTCHDFIVATSEKNSPLMISEFTGSAELFKEGCLLTNPWDVKRLSEIIKFALEMSPEEKRRRWKKMMKKIVINDSDNWIISSIKSINSSWELNIQRSTILNLNYEVWQNAYTNCAGKNKLFVLKISEPPSPVVLKMLNDLTSVPENQVFVFNAFDKIVIERSYARVNNLNLIAENGAFVRIDGLWYTLMGNNLWKNEVLPLLQDKLERLPGSYIKAGESMYRIHTENAEDKDRVNDIVGDLILHINTLFGSKKGVHAYFHNGILFVQQFGLSLRALKFIFDYYATSGSAQFKRIPSFNLSTGDTFTGSLATPRPESNNSPLLYPVRSPITPSTPSKVQLQLKSVNSSSKLNEDMREETALTNHVDSNSDQLDDGRDTLARPHLNTVQSFEHLSLLTNDSNGYKSGGYDNLKGVNKFSFAMITGSSSPTFEPLFEYINRFTGVNIAYTYTCVYGDPSSTNAQQHVNGINDLVKLFSSSVKDDNQTKK
ncbi:hypothetical protein QEN19_003729 [Hanseniaspora menglaensis]